MDLLSQIIDGKYINLFVTIVAIIPLTANKRSQRLSKFLSETRMMIDEVIDLVPSMSSDVAAKRQRLSYQRMIRQL